VFNNIVVEAARGVDYVLPAAGQAIGVLSLLSDYNVLFACKQAIVAAFNPQMHPWIHAGVQYDCETRTTDPGLASPSTGDLAPTTSEAIDRAASLAYPPSWHQVCGGGPDIGAIEVCRP
jgi:hypothetical protein